MIASRRPIVFVSEPDPVRFEDCNDFRYGRSLFQMSRRSFPGRLRKPPNRSISNVSEVRSAREVTCVPIAVSETELDDAVLS
jgi:hypothetical protein